jgi:glycosyltransferase involved in cell wall biosynthesis
MGLAKALKERGHEVILLAPRDEFTDFLLQEGFKWVNFPVMPRGKNIFQEISPIFFLVSFYRREKPDMVHHFTPKGVIYGAIAAKISGVGSIFNTITGLGYVFSDTSKKILQGLVLSLYRIALANTNVIFQNPDDQKFFYEKAIINHQESFLVPGSGVDMEKFNITPLPDGTPVVFFSSRFVVEKGIRYFIESARIIKSRNIKVRLVLVGGPEKNQPTSIQTAEIEQWVNEGVVEWWGWQYKMEDIYPMAHIFCLSTYYREGIPKVLIEAAACGRPLIATDMPGCREIVHHGENGILVPPKNAVALADAIEKLAMDIELCERMGKKSREIAISKFSMEAVVRSYFEIYKI